MPSFSRKITKEQTRDLVAHVRALAPGPDKAGAEKQEEDISASAFDEKFRRLQEEMAELKKQFRQAAKVPRDRKTSKPSKSLGSADPSESSKRQPRAAPRISAPAPSATPTGQELFRQHCVKCHGADGTGRNTRRRQLNIPDFTDAAWQARRSDAQLLTSILGGKGKEMPRWRGKISTEQARSLTAYVRTLPQVGTRRGRSHRRSPLRPKLLDRLNRQEACPRNSSGGLGNSTQRSCTSPSRC